MKKLLGVILLAALIPASGFGKARTLPEPTVDRSNAVSASVLINGTVFFGAAFDKMVTEDIGLGAGFNFASSLGATVYIIPVYLNYYFMQGPFRPFIGGGVDILTLNFGGFSGTGVGFDVQGGVEYRGESGFLFRAYPQLVIGSGGTTFLFGANVGYAF